MRIRNMISAVMPVYNGGKYLEETIKSVIRQSIESWELIIIDDGSTDETESIARKYAELDKRISYQKNEHNIGVARSLNRGLDLVRGEYIARVDADDPLYRERFEVQREFLESHPEIGILGSGYLLETLSEAKPHFPKCCKDSEIKAGFIVGNDLAHSTLMIRADLFKKTGLKYDPSYKLEDYELWTRMAFHTKFAVLKQILIKHRVHSESVCEKMGEDFYLNCRNIVKNYLKASLNIDVKDYDATHFFAYNVSLKERVEGNYFEYAAEEFRLLSAVEKANKEKVFFQHNLLVKQLKSKWNWMIGSLKLQNQENRMGLPWAEEKGRGGFSFHILCKLLGMGILDSEDVGEKEICDAIRNIQRKSIVVYGLGLKLYSYFDIDGNVDGKYVVAAFCDRDSEMFGHKMWGKPVIQPKELEGIHYDYIVVTSDQYFEEIKNDLISRYAVNGRKIVPARELLG